MSIDISYKIFIDLLYESTKRYGKTLLKPTPKLTVLPFFSVIKKPKHWTCANLQQVYKPKC